MSAFLVNAARAFAVIVPATLVITTAVTTPACGGCYDKASNFAIAPAESCLHPSADACGATLGTLTLENDCTVPVSFAATLAEPDAGSDAGSLSATTIAPGATGEVNVPAGVGHVDISGTLGTTPIVITYDVTSS